MTVKVEGNIIFKLDNIIPRFRPLKNRFHSGGQLAGTKGLGQVIISAAGETVNSGLLATLGCQHNNGRVIEFNCPFA